MEPQVLLIIVLLGGGIGDEHPMPSMEVCERAVATSKVVIPNGDENERGAIVYCAFEDNRPGWLDKLDVWLKS